MVLIKRFNELTNKEVWQIAMLRVAVFTIEQNIKEEELEYEDFNAIHYFIKKNNIIVSYARVIMLEKQAKVGRVCTMAKYRNLGFQKRIMEQIMNTYSDIFVSAQESVIDFYKKFGFKEVGEKYIEAGIIHQKMIYIKSNEHL